MCITHKEWNTITLYVVEKNTKGLKLQTRFFSRNDDTPDTGGWKYGDHNLISNYANELLFCADPVKQRGVFRNCLTTATNL